MTCDICSCHTSIWMVHDHLWKKHAANHLNGMLCMPCFQKKLGRKLRLEDFIAAPCNLGIFALFCYRMPVRILPVIEQVLDCLGIDLLFLKIWKEHRYIGKTQAHTGKKSTISGWRGPNRA